MRLGLGTVQFGLDYGISNVTGRPSVEKVADILAVAWDAGVRVLDTAPVYGESEVVLGQLIAEFDGFQVVTKCPVIGWDAGSKEIDQVEETFFRSLERLKLPDVYGLMVHSADDIIGNGGEALIDKLNHFKEEDLVRSVGVSIYNNEQLEGVLRKFTPDLVQLPLSVIDQRLLQSGRINDLHCRGVEIHARSIFLQGLLLVEPKKLTQYFEPMIGRLNAYRDELKEHGLSPLQGALMFMDQLADIDVALIGVNQLSGENASHHMFQGRAIHHDNRHHVTACPGIIRVGHDQ